MKRRIVKITQGASVEYFIEEKVGWFHWVTKAKEVSSMGTPIPAVYESFDEAFEALVLAQYEEEEKTKRTKEVVYTDKQGGWQ